jgi:hypothetical protein
MLLLNMKIRRIAKVNTTIVPLTDLDKVSFLDSGLFVSSSFFYTFATEINFPRVFSPKTLAVFMFWLGRGKPLTYISHS